MKQYTISYTKGEPEWSSIPSITADCVNWRVNPGIRMDAQIAWNEGGIYFHSVCVEKNIRAELSGQGQNVFEDSCMEFFFRPDEKDPRYFNFETNFNAAQFIGIGTNLDELIHLVPLNSETLFDVKTAKTEDGWELWFHIPIEFMRNFFNDLTLKEGDAIYANIFKCGDYTVVRHSLSWNEMEQSNHTFHNPDYFGRMLLGNK